MLSGYHVPRWFGLIIQFVAFPAAHGLLPWALSLFSARHGWTAGKPSSWNTLGLIPAAAGFYISFLSIREHFAEAPNGWKLERTAHYPTPSYLLTQGPYRYSCHPIYLAEGVIWLGWITFYGNFIVAGVFAIAVVLGPSIVRREERGLEAKFGDAYREYRRTTSRWFGRPGG